MRYVDSEWKAIQKLPITTESDVELHFYVNGTTKVLTAKDLVSFTYRQSGSIANRKLPVKEVRFSCFKDTYEFDLNQNACLVFKFKKRDGSGWTQCVIGSFQVSHKEVPENGLVQNYVMDNLWIKPGGWTKTQLDLNYTEGSNWYELGEYNKRMSLYDLSYNLRCPVPNISRNRNEVGHSLPIVSWAEAIQMVAVCGGYIMDIKGNSSAISEYNNAVTYIEYSSLALADYKINDFNLYNKPEKTEREIVRDILIYTYTNKKANAYYDTQAGDYINCGVVHFSNFDYNDVTSEDDPEIPSDYWTYYARSRVDPSKVWGVFDFPGDTTYQFSDNYAYSFATEQLSSDYLAYSLMETTKEEKYYYFNRTGTEFVVDNCLINSNYLTIASDFFKWALNYTENIECECRIDPRLDLFDVITIKSGNKEYKKVCVEDITISYSGGFKGKVKGVWLKAQIVPNTPTSGLVAGREYVIKNDLTSISVIARLTNSGKLTWRKRDKNTLEVLESQSGLDTITLKGNATPKAMDVRISSTIQKEVTFADYANASYYWTVEFSSTTSGGYNQSTIYNSIIGYISE